jgi:hypothetical protein
MMEAIDVHGGREAQVLAQRCSCIATLTAAAATSLLLLYATLLLGASLYGSLADEPKEPIGAAVTLPLLVLPFAATAAVWRRSSRAAVSPQRRLCWVTSYAFAATVTVLLVVTFLSAPI